MEALRQLSRYLPRRSRLGLVIFVALGLAAGLLEAIVLVLLVSSALAIADSSGIVDLGLPLMPETVGVNTALATAAVAGLATLVIHLAGSYLGASVSADVLGNSRRALISAYSGTNWETRATDREGALQDSMGQLGLNASLTVLHLSNAITAALGLGALLISALVLDPAVTSTVIGIGACLFLSLRPLTKITRRHAAASVQANAVLAERVAQWSTLITELRTFGVRPTQEADVGDVADVATRAQKQSRLYGRAGAWIFRDAAFLMLVGGAALLHATSFEDVTALGAIVLLVLRSLSYAQQVQANLQQFNEFTPHLDELTRRIDKYRSHHVMNGARDEVPRGELRFDEVSYVYPDGRPGLRSASFAVSEGEFVGVVGPSGGGKSTVARLILRTVAPSEGLITVGGIDTREFTEAAWGAFAASVPQEPILFSGTIADNIRFFRSGVSDLAIENAARQANIADEIEALPNGYETRLGPGGAGLSGGQRQRVAIARALAGAPRLLVLDEPTSALDRDSQIAIEEAIARLTGQLTIVFIAHRLSFVEYCDKVLAFEGAGLLAAGSPSSTLSALGWLDG